MVIQAMKTSFLLPASPYHIYCACHGDQRTCQPQSRESLG